MRKLKTIGARIAAVLLILVALAGVSCGEKGGGSPDGHDHEGHADHEESGKDEHGHAEGGKDDHGHGGGEREDHSDHEKSGKDEHGHAEGGEDDHGHGGHGHDEGKSGAEYSKEKGILIHEEAREVIQLKTAKAYEEDLALVFTATARVYQADHKHAPDDDSEADWSKGHALAIAIITPEQADALEEGSPVVVKHVGMSDQTDRGILVRLDRATTQAIGQVEALIAIPAEDHREEFGSFLRVTFSGKTSLTTAIPKSALLNAATGNFVYVERNDRFKLTPVKVGTVGSEHIGILEGIEPGDVVVSNGNVGLWLIELRFTKGGGHSH